MLKVKLLDMGNPRVLLSTALSPPNLQDIVRTVLQLKEVLLALIKGSCCVSPQKLSFWGETVQSFWGRDVRASGGDGAEASGGRRSRAWSRESWWTRGGVTPDLLCR